MFEEEAKKYQEEVIAKKDYPHSITLDWQRGAEFGYNKANEWHYVKDGDLPKAKTWVIGFYYGKDNWHKIFYRADGNWWGEGQLCQPPYAWKEIVPPEEIKEND